jgi:hypothetical protein
LYPLSLVLNRVIDETGETAELIEGRIVNIFLIFSQAESHVKDLVADRMILKRKWHPSIRRMQSVRCSAACTTSAFMLGTAETLTNITHRCAERHTQNVA